MGWACCGGTWQAEASRPGRVVLGHGATLLEAMREVWAQTKGWGWRGLSGGDSLADLLADIGERG